MVRVDAAKFAAQRVPGDLGERAGKLDAGGAAAHHDEGQPGGPFHRVAFALGALEGGEHAPADLERVFQRLQARRVSRPFVMTEVAVRRTGRQDEVVVRQLIAVLQAHHPA